eukprot:TRINITY_DN67461_c1_g2_i1.p1 TRINITY_DN67461_c1_g2~~TRINITY_DN67461_c1_g2_i1.p1  ORF type:complete len:645 (+),score=93.26 TRINITY_DN67461_c1_g2_i1:121-2055(+)
MIQQALGELKEKHRETTDLVVSAISASNSLSSPAHPPKEFRGGGTKQQDNNQFASDLSESNPDDPSWYPNFMASVKATPLASTLEEAVQPLINKNIVPELLLRVQSALRYAAEKAHELYPDNDYSNRQLQSFAAVVLYTMHWDPNDDSLYIKLNSSLRDNQGRKQKMVDWYPYIKLLIVGLKEHAEPTTERKLFRGQPLPADAIPAVQRKFKSQGIVHLWAFTSTSSSIITPAEYAESEPWLCEFCPPPPVDNDGHSDPPRDQQQRHEGSGGDGVIPHAFYIGRISHLEKEREILLLPCSQWRVDTPISEGTAIKTTSLQAVKQQQQDWSWLDEFPKLTRAPKNNIIVPSSLSSSPSSSRPPTVLQPNAAVNTKEVFQDQEKVFTEMKRPQAERELQLETGRSSGGGREATNTQKMEDVLKKHYNSGAAEHGIAMVNLTDEGTKGNMVASTEKFHFIFVLDESGSMQGRPWAALVTAYRTFLAQRVTDQGQPTDDLVSVISFASHARIQFSHQPMATVSRNLSHQSGGTSYKPAIDQVFNVINTPGCKPIVIFMSDGFPGDAAAGQARMRQLFQQYPQLQLFTIAFGAAQNNELQNLASCCGAKGKFVQTMGEVALVSTFQTIAAGGNTVRPHWNTAPKPVAVC